MPTEATPGCTPEQIDEAAVWMALLHSQDRNERTDRGFKRWLAAHPANAAAFEKVAIVHELTGRIPLKPLPPPNLLRDDDELASWSKASPPPRQNPLRHWMVATAAVVTLTAGAIFLHNRSSAIETAVGEQRTLTLPDGSQVTLNTDTRISVRYEEQRRAIELKSGEALFDVAKDPNRPFIVTAGDRTVTALGTTFNVRRDTTQLAVTLIDGKVAIASTSLPATAEGLREGANETQLSSYSPSSNTTGNSSASAQAGGTVELFDKAPTADVDSLRRVILTAGQRLTIRTSSTNNPASDEAAKDTNRELGEATIDQPSIARITAWRNGRVEFDKTPLGDAIDEINRYNTVKLTCQSAAAANIPITGTFRAGSARSFAGAVAASYNLQIKETDTQILLTGVTSTPPTHGAKHSRVRSRARATQKTSNLC